MIAFISVVRWGRARGDGGGVRAVIGVGIAVVVSGISVVRLGIAGMGVVRWVMRGGVVWRRSMVLMM